jgi:LysR family transcriptional regulator, glycine cleavage system transcriptional activator
VPQGVAPDAVRLFGEQLTPMASPWLLKERPLAQMTDLAHFTLIEAGDAHRTRHLEWLTWQRWLDEFGAAPETPTAPGAARNAAKTQPLRKALSPQRWLYFNYAHQIVQAAISGQGVALARLPLVADSLASGALVEPLPQYRLNSPLVYWLLVAPRSAMRPEVKAFCTWLMQQAAETREAIGDVPDPDTLDHLD